MHALCSRTILGHPARAALLFLLATWACGGSTESRSTPTTPPKVDPPVRVLIVQSPATTGGPRSAAGQFIVQVLNEQSQPVYGARVVFKTQSGRPGFTFAPSDTVTSADAGIASVEVTYGTIAGTDRLLATAAGVKESAKVDIKVEPGPPALLNISPTGLHLFEAGDSATFQAVLVDDYQNTLDTPPELRLSDSTLVSITPPTTPLGTGMVRALKGSGTVTITSPAVSRGALTVTVFPNPRNACGGLGPPRDFATSVPVAVADSAICIAANPRGAAYALMVYNESADGATSRGTTVTGYNVVPEMLPALSVNRVRPSLAHSPMLLRRSSVPTLDLRFHQRLLEQSRSLRRLFGPARAARSFAGAGSVGRIRGPSYARSSAAPSVPAVDDLVALNVASDACTTADTRTLRVEAVGTHAIVLADTANPEGGGFTREDYERFAARFDTLVYPLDVGYFDAPSDIDGNGHVAILFTRAVNELTPPNANAFVGGFFHPRDLFPRTQSSTFAVCPTSNEGEMFYVMVPDPGGTVNGNAFRRGFVDTLTTGILAHEFQHLINAGRRMYVNTSATSFEETWLNEGLSHEAEELLFFHESGYAPRSQLGAQSILDDQPHFSAWVSDDASNFVNFYYYLRDPANHSPIDPDDRLETRGSTWAFLRYAVDRSFPTDVGVWQRFTNSTTTGFGTLSFALQRDPKAVLKDFAITNMMGGHPSWNFGDVYSQVFIDGSYPLAYGLLKEGAAVPVVAKGGSASYWKFAVPPDAQTLLKFGSSAAPPDGNLRFVLVRTALAP